jgi:hypothetical protein
MKTVTRLAIASLMMVMALAGWVHAQTPVKVTFRVNTATVKDTLRTNDIVQMRGAVNGNEGSYNGKVINWGSGSELIMESKGNNTWELGVMMTPGDTFKFKYWVGYRNSAGEIVNTETVPNTGWENSPDREYTLPAGTTQEVVLPLNYYDNISLFGPIHPDTIQVHFRVNVGRAIQDGLLDINNENHKVQARGGTAPLDWGSGTVTLKKDENPGSNVGVQFYSGVAKFPKANLPANGNVAWKFAIDRGADGVTWEDGNDKVLNLSDNPSTRTIEWSFFNGLRPSNAKRINTSFNFAIQVGALERLNLFDASKGDSVFVASDLTGWAGDTPYAGDPREKVGPSGGAMTFESSIGAWSKIIPRPNVVVGSSLNFKYYIQWAKARFVNNILDINYRPNSYIPGLTGDTGYEEPGQFGGGNRLYTVVDSEDQNTFNLNEGISFFNGIPFEAFINKDNTANGALTLKFNVDMNPAITNTQAARPFNPQRDSVFIHFETKFFARTQGTIPGDEGESVFGYNRTFESYKPTLKDLERIQLKDPDGDGIYTLDFPLNLPTLNDIGYRIVYGQPISKTDDMIIQQKTFEAGRRYYQYIKPTVVNGQIRWPSTYSFPVVQWKYNNLPFESLPNYTSILSSDEGEFSDLPEGYALEQNYPNPFNPSTTITFTLPIAGDVKLNVFNALGQKVATVLNNQRFTSGMHSVNFDASRLASGVYIYRLEANTFTADRKMVLIK